MVLPRYFLPCQRRFHQLSAKAVFCAALLCIPACIVQKNVAILWAEICMFCMLALLQRGTIRLLPSVLITICVCFFELCTPRGKILFAPITQGALHAGLKKSGTLVAMVFLSQTALSAQLQLPGTVGSFFAYTLRIFNTLTRQLISLKRGHIIAAIDEHILQAWHECDSLHEHTPVEAQQHSAVHCALPFLLPALVYAALLVPVLAKGRA